MNYYERHLGDYARDTAHLSLLEHGAYTILLDRFYATEQGIPVDQAHRIARAKSKDERAAVDAVLAEFFELQDGAYIQKRALAEIQKAQTRINAARANGRTGGRPKRNPEETQRVPGGFNSGTQAKALQTPDSNLQTPSTRHQTPESSIHAQSGSPSREAGFDSDWLDTIWPPTANNRNSATAIHHAMALVNLGHCTWQTLRKRVEGFAQHCATGGYSDPTKVPGMVSWFRHDHPERYWARDWAPAPTKAEQQRDANIDAAQKFLNRNRGAA